MKLACFGCLLCRGLIVISVQAYHRAFGNEGFVTLRGSNACHNAVYFTRTWNALEHLQQGSFVIVEALQHS
jgi:hypothetical protein